MNVPMSMGGPDSSWACGAWRAGRRIFAASARTWPWPADGWARRFRRNPETRGFHVVKRRWVVERSIGWIMMHRRLARDYETLTASSEAVIHIASVDNLARRITDEITPTWRGTY